MSSLVSERVCRVALFTILVDKEIMPASILEEYGKNSSIIGVIVTLKKEGITQPPFVVVTVIIFDFFCFFFFLNFGFFDLFGLSSSKG